MTAPIPTICFSILTAHSKQKKYKRALKIKNNFFIASSKEENILCLAVIITK